VHPWFLTIEVVVVLLDAPRSLHIPDASCRSRMLESGRDPAQQRWIG